MRFRLVATDLDGTILPTEQRDPVAPDFTDRMARTLARVREAGAHLIAVTARSPRSAAPLARRLGLRGPIICGTGSIIYDLEGDKIERTSGLEAQIGARLVKELRIKVPGVQFAAEQGLNFAREPGYPLSPFTPELHDELDAIGFVGRAPTTKLIARHHEMDIEALFAEVLQVAGDDAYTELSGAHWVGMLHPQATKGAALAALCSSFGIGAHEVVAFGDHLPDESMLRWAGLGVAVANARSEILEAADRIAPSNDEDGVATVLEELLDAGYI